MDEEIPYSKTNTIPPHKQQKKSKNEKIFITLLSFIIRTPVCDIPTYSRTAGGVIVMRLGEGQSLVNFTCVKREEEEEEELTIDN